MSWLNLNQSFNSLKGQITTFATEVLAEAPGQDTQDLAALPETTLSELQVKCQNQELEIAALKKLSDELQASLQSERLARQNGVKEEESSWYWDPPAQTSKLDSETENHYKVQIRALQDELSTLKDRDTIDLRPDTDEELNRLREENQNLTANLEDLDNQHQQAMERLLSLKKELQTNFEVLKKDHEELQNNNEVYADEIKVLQETVGERDKEIISLKAVKSDYDTLHHKYQNLEKIYALLRENAEKFQEENQDLHEEVFKLQEQTTKLEHDLEILSKNAEVSTTVPKELYNEVLKELNDLKDRRNANQMHLDEINIDDNAKSVIENLKHEINDLKHQLSQKDADGHGDADHKIIKAEKIMQLYNKYVNFEIPLDYVGEIPSVGDNLVLYKLESVFKTVNSFKKEIDALEHRLSEKNHNIKHLQTQIDDLTTENDFLTTDVQHFERELNEMKKNNDFLISEIATLKNTSKLEPIIETNHEDNLAKLETELADCNKVNRTFESEIKRIEIELEEVKKEKTSLQESLSELKTKYTTMLSEIDMCKNKTEAVEELEKSVHSQQNESLKTATSEIDDLIKKLNIANSKNEQLSIDIHIIENQKMLLMKQVDDLKNTIEEKASAHKELEALKLALDNKLHDFEIKLDEVILHKTEVENEKLKLEEYVATLETQLSQNIHKGDLDIIREENNKLKENIQKLQTENSTLTGALKYAEGEMQTMHEMKEEFERLKNNSVVAETTPSNKQAEEIHVLEENIQKLENKNKQLTAEQTATDVDIGDLEKEFEKLMKDIAEKDELIDALNSTLIENKATIIHLNQTITDLKNNVHQKDEEQATLNLKIETVSNELTTSIERQNQTQEELHNVQNVTRKISEESDNLKHDISNKNEQIAMLNKSIEELVIIRDEYKITIENKDKEIKELNQSLIEFKDRNKTPENVHHNDVYAGLVVEKEDLQKELTALKNIVSTKDSEISILKAKADELTKLNEDYKTAIDNSVAEKANLVTYLNAKHNESVQYHNEIQRLNKVFEEKEKEFKHYIEESDKFIKNNSACQSCENLRTTLKEKDAIIKTLNQNTAEVERLKLELANASEVVRNLTEKCDEADKNLTAQLEVVKKLTAEKAQLSEHEQNSSRELERLRRHLVDTEESYTQELMTSEQKLTECQARLHAIEERAKQTSTVYTSNSIRANQEVETLRTQIKLLEKQREEVQAKLSEADDARSRSEAALTNLQIVLEQFQLDKERDIKAATEKIRNKMDALKQENSVLQDEIARLNRKLEESLAGLQAATRLGDQLETRTAQINDLKDQVRTLQTSVAAAEERYYNAISNQQDKVDKNLVKNLVTNYVMTAASSKLQVLKVLSTVLDFNQQECEKLGLVRTAAPDSLAAEFVKFLQNESTPRPPLPPLNTISRSTTPSISRRSSTTVLNSPFSQITNELVKFLQNESTPRPPLPPLKTTSRSTTPAMPRRSSITGPNPTFIDASHKRNPSTASTGSNNLLFTSIDNVETSSQLSRDSVELRQTLDTGVNQTRNNEGAILKHVLRDM